YDRFTGGGYFVHPLHDRMVRRFLNNFRIVFSLFSDFYHNIDKRIEGFFTLGFCRLDHETFLDDEWKVNCRRMYTEIKQSFCDIEGTYTKALLPIPGQHEFMFTPYRVRHFIVRL